ncbi:MAG: response regulator [Pyrinomonadaceae bacterium]
MDLTKTLIEQLADPGLGLNETARLRCRLSNALEESGDYEASREAMSEFWSRIGERPLLEGLDQATAAEVLLQVGKLTSCIGSGKQVEGAQETAKNLIGESLTIFDSLQDIEKAAEAQTDLAMCYWRQGAFDEARVLLRDAVSRLGNRDSEVKAVALIRNAIVERTAKRLNDALHIYIDAAPLFEKIKNQVLKGKFHIGFALVLRNLGEMERRDDYTDRALVEYAAASFHFEQAGCERYYARVENNLGFLFSTVNKFADAHEHIDKARRTFVKLKDKGSIAQVDETRARVFLAEGRNAEAEKTVLAAVHTLEKGDERALLAEAMTTHGIALARTGCHERARFTLQSAVEIAQRTGDYEGAGQAALTIIEELGERLTTADLSATYERAAELLVNSQHPGIMARLNACARRVLYVLEPQLNPASDKTVGGDKTAAENKSFSAPLSWRDFSLRKEVRRYERHLIEHALKDAGGAVSKASYLLGFNHHQSLVWIINSRHKNLLEVRSPVSRRRRSIIREPQALAAAAPSSPAASPRLVKKATRTVTILHVEDNEMVAAVVKDCLELEGWRVEICVDAASASQKMAGGEHYDLLLLDYDLPDSDGVELIKEARQLAHRKHTPIVMLAASNCEREAWRAGANAYLRKPEDILCISETIARLVDPEASSA